MHPIDLGMRLGYGWNVGFFEIADDVGLVANQPMHNAGAMDTDGIDKVIRFLCLCDSFDIIDDSQAKNTSL